ncbi:uncharacterized protein BKA78DRAFT_364086 [Phyllosticta capitalensis]|uniref:uncharacterized protein n=1 Tax=Phyllosticta capitalensis TaxID=121624 RepID=UPI003130A1D8
MKKPAPTLFWTLCFACLLFNNNTSTTSVSLRGTARSDSRTDFNVGYAFVNTGVFRTSIADKREPVFDRFDSTLSTCGSTSETASTSVTTALVECPSHISSTSPCSGTDYDLAGAWSWGGRLCVPVDRLPQPRLQASRIQHHNWIEIGACLASIKSLNENLGRNQVCALIRLQDAADTIFTNEFGCGFRCRLQIDLLRVDFELTDFRVHGVNQTLCHRLAREFNYTNNFIHTVRGLGNGSGQKQWQLWNRLQGCQDHHCLSCGFRGRLVVEIDLLRVAAKLKAEYRENREDNKIFEEPSSTEPGLEHVQNTALMVVAVSRPRQSTTALTPRRGGRNAAADANAISLRNVRDGVDVRTRSGADRLGMLAHFQTARPAVGCPARRGHAQQQGRRATEATGSQRRLQGRVNNERGAGHTSGGLSTVMQSELAIPLWYT